MHGDCKSDYFKRWMLVQYFHCTCDVEAKAFLSSCRQRAILWSENMEHAHLTVGRIVVWGEALAWPVSDRFLSSTRVTALQFTIPFVMLSIQLLPFNLWCKITETSAVLCRVSHLHQRHLSVPAPHSIGDSPSLLVCPLCFHTCRGTWTFFYLKPKRS